MGLNQGKKDFSNILNLLTSYVSILELFKFFSKPFLNYVLHYKHIPKLCRADRQLSSVRRHLENDLAVNMLWLAKRTSDIRVH